MSYKKQRSRRVREKKEREEKDNREVKRNAIGFGFLVSIFFILSAIYIIFCREII